jgi:hypothetical protein
MDLHFNKDDSLALGHPFSEYISLTSRLVSSLLLMIENENPLNGKHLQAFSDHISTFVDITTLITKFYVTRHNDIKEIIKKSHIQLLFIMKGILLAKEKQDLVVLNELIKHELNDNLTQWKINLLPQLKKIANL